MDVLELLLRPICIGVCMTPFPHWYNKHIPKTLADYNKMIREMSYLERRILWLEKRMKLMEHQIVD